MDFRQIKTEAKEALIGNRFMLFLAILVYNLLSAALGMALIGFLISPILYAGLYYMIKELLQIRSLDFNKLFFYFKDLNHGVKLFGVWILTGLIVFLGFILLIIPGFIFALRYSQALFIMADNPNYTIGDALRKSKEMMYGHKWELFVFYLSFIGHILLTAITFGLYGIYFLPYLYTCTVNYYNHLKQDNSLTLSNY